MALLHDGEKKYVEETITHFDGIHEQDGQTHRQTDTA